MRKALIASLVALMLGWVAFAGPAAAQFFDVMNPGPLTSFDIDTTILNLDGFDLLSATFDTSGTAAVGGGGGPLVFDDLVPDFPFPPPPPGGTANLVVNSPTSWTFTFTSFNNGESFTFGWDPDTASAPAYGATVAELVGMEVTLVTSGGTVSGTYGLFDNGTGVRIPSPTAVPEPSSILLLTLAAAGLVGVVRRNRKS